VAGNSAEERRKTVLISDEQMTEIAEMAAAKAIEKMTTDFYKSVGQTVVSRGLIMLGALSFAGYLWAKKQGII
jgi:hypothetical protein